jgi:hypothetical protein
MQPHPDTFKKSYSIYYTRNSDDARGIRWGDTPEMDKFALTHVYVSYILPGKATLEEDLEEIFMAMQGENWSPNGEQNEMIRGLDTHTSMSVGDVVLDRETGTFWLCASQGWTKIWEPTGNWAEDPRPGLRGA